MMDRLLDGFIAGWVNEYMGLWKIDDGWMIDRWMGDDTVCE